jgi:hypothetical protein
LILAFVSLAASGAFAYLAYRVWKKKEGEEAPEGVGTEIAPPEILPTDEVRPAIAPLTPAPSAPASAEATHERPIPVATLLRDELTGGLVIRVGEREYRTASELLESKDRKRMEYTAAELSRWLGLDKPTSTLPAPAEAKPAAPQPPKSMVEQINTILDRKLQEKPEPSRAVRLVEASGGGIKVYVGIDSYNAIDDVPDAEIRQLIREAVAEWEAGE